MLEYCPAAQSPKGGDYALLQYITVNVSIHGSLNETRELNFFGRQWRGLFWVEPFLLNHCMVLATVLQLSFRVLAILRRLYVEQ